MKNQMVRFRLPKVLCALFLVANLCLTGCDAIYFASYEITELNPDPRIEYKSALRHAKEGDVTAQSKVADILYSACRHPADAWGWRPKCDMKASQEWAYRAAKAGNAEGAYRLGIIYETDGYGVSADLEEARKWLLKSASQGNTEAQTDLFDIYFYGRGVPQNYSDAYFWLLVANRDKNHIGLEFLNDIKPHLTPTQQAKIEDSARSWRPTKYESPASPPPTPLQRL